ncbi:pyridoxal phosphate-dependent aminotransferase [Gordonia insulae]|uniref:Phenylalanine aminotransferase n=1 Tax=Gordonia insulae TaxID=2420509 RepID=A0A3G8JLH1_9ACTN|nr:aminotransferase class I/II-fold pyridoxal phosphate-dependent enzyme [Gordonia insulae]AZG45289.1 Putative phenylalanine aminotransferase [Gordonia insulae]
MSPPFAPRAGARPPVRLNLNESAYPPLPSVADVLREGVVSANRYPDFLPDATRVVIADRLGVPAELITVGAGATGIALSALQMCARRAASRGTATPAMVTATPTFDGYPILAAMVGMRMDAVALGDDGRVDLDDLFATVTPDTVAVVVCSPHNPTGSVVDEEDLHEFIEALPTGVLTILDEAYVEFCARPPDLHRLAAHDDVLVLRTFSKAHGLAALRAGYGIGSPSVAAAMRRHEVPFALGSAAIAAIPVALDAEQQLAQRVHSMRQERARMVELLDAIGCRSLPSQANFLFLPGADGIAIGRLLGSCGVATKECAGRGTRITVGDRASTDYVVQSLRLTALTA